MEAGPTTDVKTHTYRFEGQNEQCSYLKQQPRSGLAAKKGITVLNSPGTVDADYRGEIGVILVNLSNEDFIVNDGERIAQLVIAKHEQINWKEVTVLNETERGKSTRFSL